MSPYVYNAKLNRIIDGDTIEVTLDLGFKIYQVLPVRLAHIDAPEHNTHEGQAAIQHITALLGNDPLILVTYKPKDKYGRYLAEVYIGETCINELMVKDGFAKPYEGGAK